MKIIFQHINMSGMVEKSENQARWFFSVRARTEGAGEQGKDKEGAIFLHDSKE